MLQNCLEKKVPLKMTAVPNVLHANALHANVLHTNVSLAPFTSFRVGGLAEWYAAPRSVEDLIACFEWATLEKIPVTMLGAGSNLLISDRGLSGLILSTRHFQGAHYDDRTGQITALAGEPLPRIAWEAARRGWRGLEWAAGIPGTVGGAVVMNAGAQGSCTADFLCQVQVISPQGIHWLTAADLHYSYRSSLLQKKQFLALQATFQLTPGGNPQEVIALTRQNLAYRKSTQPYHLPSCGSVFRNPNPYKAGWLIEQSGLKGYQIGNAQVSQRHANFIVNLGGATATDIFYLIHYVQDCIQAQWGIELEPEVKMLGEFPTVYLAERAAS